MPQVNKIKIRRGLNANIPAPNTEVGELRYSTDSKELYIDDGSSNVKIGGDPAGFPVSTAQQSALDGKFAQRTITGTTNQITVTNGDGVSGNPTLSLPQDIHTGASPTFAGLTVDTDTLFVDSANHRLGINTTSPLSGVDVRDVVNGATLRLTGLNTTNDEYGSLIFSSDFPEYEAYGASITGDKAGGVDTGGLTFSTSYGGAGRVKRISISPSGHLQPTTDSTYTLGTSSLYWSNTYTDKLYLNSTAYLDGATAGTINLGGNLEIPVTDAGSGRILQDGKNFLHSYGKTGSWFKNVFLGYDSGSEVISMGGAAHEGTGNIGIGNRNLKALTSGYYNIAIGSDAGLKITTGNYNFIAGHTAANSLTTGANNFLMGGSTGFAMTSGSNNVGIGAAALRNAVVSTNNVAIGTNAGYTTTGSSNVFLGYQAGYNETGSNKLYISNSNTSTPLIKGDFAANTIETPASIEITDTAKGVIMKSPDGTRYRLTVANGGTLTITAA